MKIYTFYRNILIGIPIGITVLDSVGYVARVDGSSMQPALNPDNSITDYIFLNRWTVRSYEIERGDIVSLISPKNPDQKIVKRVIGLQGDIINTLGYKKPYICIPEGYCWIEGDHTGNSFDSNTFGPVSIGLITAKASAVVWPPSRWQKIRSNLPQDRIPVNLGLEFDFACGTGVLRDAMTIGDVDNDGKNELIVGNTSGDLVLFKEKEQWQKITGLGMISCVGIGDILNCGCNALVVIGGDGWCRIFYCPSMIPSKESETSSDHHHASSPRLECIHIQRIPANSKVVLLGDIDGDGLIEMVIALTDRVVRSYRWYESDQLSPETKQFGTSEHFKSGKLVCLNKWESSNQIGAVTLQKNPDGIPALLVAQPGGTFMRIRCNHENNMIEQSLDNASMTSENLTAPGVDYQFLGISQMRNQSVSTEIIADLYPKNALTDSNKIKPYAVATLDGTIMLVREEVILWAIQVDHQIFALEKLDITGDGSEDIVACSWDGQTYMLDQEKNSVRFQLDEPVQAFCSGYYNVDSSNSNKSSASLVYVTFKNKIYVYHDLQISNMVARKLNVDSLPLNKIESLDDLTENEQKIKKRQLVEKLLYG